MSFNDYIYWQTLQKTGKTPEEIYEYEHPKVVRCKECKHRQNPYAPKWCYEMSKETDADDYCSYGARKESE